MTRENPSILADGTGPLGVPQLRGTLVRRSVSRMRGWPRNALNRARDKIYGGIMRVLIGKRGACTAVYAWAAVAAVAIGGCASTGYHYSQILGTRYFKTNIDTYPVSINEVDGRSYLANAPVLVDRRNRWRA